MLTVDASKEGDPASLGPFAHALTHPRTLTEHLHLPDLAGHSGDDSEATVRGSRDDEVFLARLTLSSSQSVSWPP